MRSEELKHDWEQLLAKLSQQFPGDGDIDLDGVLLLIGAQELQMGYLRLKKDEKLNVYTSQFVPCLSLTVTMSLRSETMKAGLISKP